jgi:two-component sensor histidine kinase
MSLIHSQIYRGDRFERIDMRKQVEDLVGYLSGLFMGQKEFVNISLNVSEVYIDLTQAIPCSLILNEIISNCFKHAFKGRTDGNIEISIQRSSDDLVLLKVKDDGVGIPLNNDINYSQTLGFELIRGLVQQLKGTIQVESKHGSEVSIQFPASIVEENHAQNNAC